MSRGNGIKQILDLIVTGNLFDAKEDSGIILSLGSLEMAPVL
jgi:hypothetical protein